MLEKLRKRYIGDKAFYKHILLIAIPMIIQNAITNVVNLLDNIMVGRIGTEQMTGVAIVNQLIFVFQIFIFGAVSGAGIFGTQFYGKGDFKGQKYAFRFKMYVSILISIIVGIVFYFFDNELIGLFLSDEGKIGNIELALKYGKEYIFIIIIGLVPFAIGQAYTSSIRETGQTFIPMLAGIVAVITNLVLDVLLIFGVWRFPKLGVVGAAIATVIARYIECIIVVIWTHCNKNLNRFIVGAYKSLNIPKNILKDIIVKGSPLMLNEFLWATGMTAIVQCYSVRGLEVVAALNISNTVANVFNIVYIQLGACIAIIIGQLLGAGEEEKAKETVHKMIFFCVMCCVVIGMLMTIVGRYFPMIYNTEKEVKRLAKNFIIISAAVMPLCSYAHCAYFTLRSGGKTIITFLFDSVYTWVFMIPIAYFLSKYFNFSITLVFLLVQSTEIVKVLIGRAMIRSNIWVQNIVS